MIDRTPSPFKLRHVLQIRLTTCYIFKLYWSVRWEAYSNDSTAILRFNLLQLQFFSSFDGVM